MANATYGFITEVVNGWVYCPKHGRSVTAKNCKTKCRFIGGRHITTTSGVNPTRPRKGTVSEEITVRVSHTCNFPIDSDKSREQYELCVNWIRNQEDREPLFPERATPE